jgi:hypothetical protein
LKKGSKAAKAWGAKMKRARNQKKKSKRKTKRKTTTRKRRTTRKGDLTLKRQKAYTGLKRRVSRRKKTDSRWNF